MSFRKCALPPSQLAPLVMSVGGASLQFFVVLDSRHTYTGNTKQYVADQLLGPMSALAICQYDHDPGYYLFGCDLEWNTITDTYHETCEDAFEQASFEYAGLERHHWQAVKLEAPAPANDET